MPVFSESERKYLDQCRFLEIASTTYPEFLDELRRTVLPYFPADVSARSIRKGWKDPVFAPIEQPFRAWLQRFHVERAAWLHTAALTTMQAWRDHPNIRGFVYRAVADWPGDTGVRFDFDPLMESRDAVTRRFNAQVAEAYKQPHPFNDTHAQCLALYQFAELSPDKISRWMKDRNIHLQPDAIQKGYRVMAKRLSIPLRSPTRGKRK